MHSFPVSERLALRIPEASVLSGLSRSTLYKVMVEGKLKSIKAGKRRLILRADLEEFLKNLPSAGLSNREAA